MKVISLSTLIILHLSFTFVATSDDIYTISDFKRNYFKIISQNEGFYKIASNLEKSTNELPIAFGFVDPDFYTDIITVNTDFKSISIYLYSEDQSVFNKAMSTSPLTGDEKVISAKITYVTQSSDYPNILIVSQSAKTGLMYIRAFQITKDINQLYSIAELPNLLVTITNGQNVEPINFQISNDVGMIEYWLVVDNGVRTVINYDRTTANQPPIKTLFSTLLDSACPGCIDFTKTITNKLAPIGSHAFIDLNGDGRADFVLESTDDSNNRVFEIYMFKNNGLFGLMKTINVPKDYSIGTWVDFQENKMMDVAFWNKADNKIYIHPGVVLTGPVLGTNDQFMDDGFSYSIPSLENTQLNAPIVLDLVPGSKIHENIDLKMFGLLRFADLDLDGYMDLIVNTIDSDKTNNVHVFQNVPCPSGVESCRTFINEFSPSKIKILQNKNAVQSIFFDFGERGLINEQNRCCFC